jgi:Capsule polysaccharide biosynthesis protein
MPPARIFLHMSAPMFFGTEQPRPFWGHLRSGLQAEGIMVEHALLDRATFLSDIEGDGDFHIVNHGNFRHARVLNAALAYVTPYWYLDPQGIRAQSSIGSLTFDPDDMDSVQAAEFHRGLARRQIAARISRYPQPAARADIPDRCIAVFLQSEAHRAVEETCYLDRSAMLETLLGRSDPSPIVVKPHPRDDSAATRTWLADLSRRDARIVVADANIHDILSRAAVTVTINSAVGIEGLIHGVPLVLCGRADFHHIAETVTTPDGMDDAIRRARGTPRPCAEYLFWFFRRNCLASGSATLAQDALSRIAAAGFPAATFGP